MNSRNLFSIRENSKLGNYGLTAVMQVPDDGGYMPHASYQGPLALLA